MTETVDVASKGMITFTKQPQLEDDIPNHPRWCYYESEGRRYWATRYGPNKVYGIAVLPRDMLRLMLGPVIREVPPFAALVEITEHGWQFGYEIVEIETQDEEEALAIAHRIIERLDALVMAHALGDGKEDLSSLLDELADRHQNASTGL
ncbi:MAG: hypothetical protein ACRERD_10305 [Candidatus Binatia bacterium]